MSYFYNPPSPYRLQTNLRKARRDLEVQVYHLQKNVEALARGEAINLRVRLASGAAKIDRLRKEIDGLERALDGRVSFDVERRQIDRECERAMMYEAHRERYEGR
jgi:hypothetical protein